MNHNITVLYPNNFLKVWTVGKCLLGFLLILNIHY